MEKYKIIDAIKSIPDYNVERWGKALQHAVKVIEELQEEELPDPNVCPFCGSENIGYTSDFFEGGIDVCCMKCREKWSEAYDYVGLYQNGVLIKRKG